MKTKHVLAAVATLGMVAALAACAGDEGGPGPGNNAENCTNTIPKTDLPVVTMWAWYPNMELVVDNFNEASDDVQVCWTNVGQGGQEYEKFQTAISSGTGAPDVIMIEADRIPTFQVQNAIIDISDYGYDEVKDLYSEGAWKDVSVGDAVYAVPVDGGPMGMIYRADIFEEYGITPPTTWEEYEAAAQTVKDAGGPLFGDLGANVPAVMMALQIQAGAEPFVYDSATPENLSVNLNDAGSKKVLDYWAGLVEKGLVGTQDQFTPEYIAGVIGGDYATYISAAWAPGYLQGAGVGEGEDEGVWAVAPLPQWEGEAEVSVNWGGSAFAVTAQSSNPELAAKAAYGVYADEASLTDGWTNQVIFPLNTTGLEDPAFLELESEFFNGQQANKEVYVPAAQAYQGFNYSPIGQYYFTSFTEQLAAINAGDISGSDAADRLQEVVTQYAEEQGFTLD